MGREYNIIVVQNATSRVPNAEVKYNVKMANVGECRCVFIMVGFSFGCSKFVRPCLIEFVVFLVSVESGLVCFSLILASGRSRILNH